jgi:hypothetical protein
MITAIGVGDASHNGLLGQSSSNPWPLVLCLVGVDYFSTLAYLPSIAAEDAGPWAPIAAGGVVLVTFLLALPVYWYVVGRASDGRGATGMLEDSTPGWRGKLLVLTMLGFAAADFVITRSLSLADAAIHLIHNPHGLRLLARWPLPLLNEEHQLWPPLEYLLHRLAEPRVTVTLGLSVISFGIWQVLKRGITRRILIVTTAAVSCYLILSALVVLSALAYIAQHSEVWQAWLNVIFAAPQAIRDAATQSDSAWPWVWLRIFLWSFPQMALGLSGFEMIMNVVPRVSGGANEQSGTPAARIRNTRKLMVTAASIMAIYLMSAVLVTTLLVPEAQMRPGGAATHRALAYLAHGSPLAGGGTASGINSLFGDNFGDLYDLSSAFILCLAGLSVTLGLQNLLPHYLNRLGMDVTWAGKSAVIMHLLNVIILLITVVYRASPSLQQWAYATSVLVLLAGAALAMMKDLQQNAARSPKRILLIVLSAGAGGFFLAMTGLTMLINQSGLTIALCFVVAILISSFVSRWIRCTELRFEGFQFVDEASRERWTQLCQSETRILVPHRPGLISLAEKCHALRREHRLDLATPIIFIEVVLGDPSNFYHKPLMKIERDGDLEVIRVSHCVSVSHVLAAICLELAEGNQLPPEIIFGWSNEPPLAANLNFLLLGEGNIPWMVKELVRHAMPDPAHQPRIRIG